MRAGAADRTGVAAATHPRADALRGLLLRAARMEDPGEGEFGDVDWPGLFTLAARHRMLPLLHRHLSDAPLPPGPAAELRALNRAEAHRGLALAAELRRLLAALAAGGIDALAYKGPALAV
ncbi:MAG TPA: nucleotidyltransferase family protein, partial [Longimicrobium sp.]